MICMDSLAVDVESVSLRTSASMPPVAMVCFACLHMLLRELWPRLLRRLSVAAHERYATVLRDLQPNMHGQFKHLDRFRLLR